MDNRNYKIVSRFSFLLISLVIASLACRFFPENKLPGPPISVSTEAAATLEQKVTEAVQQADLTGAFEISLTEEQVTSYVAAKLQEQQEVAILNPQVFLRDGKLQAFGDLQQNSIQVPLAFEVEPQITNGGQPQLVLLSAQVGGVAAPDTLVKYLQEKIDEIYSGIVGSAGSNFTAESITIADGVMTIKGQVK